MSAGIKTCRQCRANFPIFPEDVTFYKKIDVPPPALCPECRDRRRWASGNDLTLYRGSCHLCKKDIISMYAPDGPYMVYCSSCWWSDGWDAFVFGVDYDFGRPFFEQFHELQIRVPRMATSTFSCENSPYVNNCGGMTNCYMCASCGFCEDSYYLMWGVNNKNCVDSFKAVRNELCYELVNTNGSYHSAWLYQCEGMNDSYFCYDCRNCSRCIFSYNLRGKDLHIYNKPVSEEEYSDLISTLKSFEKVEGCKKKWIDCMRAAVHKNLTLQNCENVVGDNVSNSANSFALFDSEQCENVRYSRYMFTNTKDCMDISAHGDGCEMSYEGYGLGTDGVNRCFFTRQCCQGCDSVSYSDLCFTSHDLFGCICLRKSSFCIFNKQYGREEYLNLKSRIIAQMRETGEYGEYFPAILSPFAYNESTAMLYYPLTKTEAIALGFRWSETLPETKGKETIQWNTVPDSIDDADDTLCKQVLACIQCSRNYKIIKQEMRLLKKLRLPLPRLCSLCRTANRLALRNPSRFWHRQCMCTASNHGHNGQCAIEFGTTYAPGRSETIYCVSCYQKEIF